LTKSVDAPTGQTGSPDTSPNHLNINGDLAAGTHADWGPITFHLRDTTGFDNGVLAFETFSTSFDNTDYASASAAYAAAHQPPGGGTTNPPGGTTEIDWNALAERVLKYFGETGQWGLLDDWLSNMPPDHGGGTAPSGGPTDWEALAVRVNAYHDATGQWGLLDQWLSSMPPDSLI
jgi:hypothetical protein